MFYKKETPRSIHLWAEDNFGNGSALTTAVRTAVEISELIVAIVYKNDQLKIQEEVADVAIMMWQVAFATGIDARPVELVTQKVLEESVNPGIIATRIARELSICLEYSLNDNKEIKRRGLAHLKNALFNLEFLVKVLEIDLPKIVDNKMEINRARRWKRLDNGSYQHTTQY